MRGGAPLAVVAGGLAHRRRSGHAWVFLNWLLGLRSLGYDVLFVDRLEGALRSDRRRPAVQSGEWAWLSQVMADAGLDGCYIALTDDEPLGADRSTVMSILGQAAVLINVMGFLEDLELRSVVRGPKVFVDIDPGYPQMWAGLGLADLMAGHDSFVTVGLSVGQPCSTVPTGGRNWITVPPPVSLDAWPYRPARTHPDGQWRATSVATWRGPFGPVEFEGHSYGLRVHEHRAYADFPARISDVDFELMLDIDPSDAADAERLLLGGWRLGDPFAAVGSVAGYQRYLQCSDLEFTTAKGMYVKSRGGWFSDRSACYLASGRPVVAQDTGFSHHLPVGAGLLAFRDPDQAEDAWSPPWWPIRSATVWLPEL